VGLRLFAADRKSRRATISALDGVPEPPWGDKSLKVFEGETLSLDLGWLKYDFLFLAKESERTKMASWRRPLIILYTFKCSKSKRVLPQFADAR
jgi:hypothetical protein